VRRTPGWKSVSVGKVIVWKMKTLPLTRQWMKTWKEVAVVYTGSELIEHIGRNQRLQKKLPRTNDRGRLIWDYSLLGRPKKLFVNSRCCSCGFDMSLPLPLMATLPTKQNNCVLRKLCDRNTPMILRPGTITDSRKWIQRYFVPKNSLRVGSDPLWLSAGNSPFETLVIGKSWKKT